MLFNQLSTITAVTIFIWANFPQLAAANQALMDCEMKCSQQWSFPTPAASPSASSKVKAKPTSTHTSTSSPVNEAYYAPVPTTTTTVVPNSPIEPHSSAKEHVAVAAPSTPLSNTPSTTITPPRSTTTQRPAQTSTSEPKDPPKSATASSSIDAYLIPHNVARAAHGASPLVWSDELAAAAQRWADNCVFEHSGGSLGPFGENLAAGSGDYRAQSGVEAWVNEAGEYSSANPVPSHFTQVVWKATTQVGCAVASCNLANFDPKFWPVKYHVCEYSAPGNVIGQFATNVQA